MGLSQSLEMRDLFHFPKSPVVETKTIRQHKELMEDNRHNGMFAVPKEYKAVPTHPASPEAVFFVENQQS
jgi:hypothetical protein